MTQLHSGSNILGKGIVFVFVMRVPQSLEVEMHTAHAFNAEGVRDSVCVNNFLASALNQHNQFYDRFSYIEGK